MPKKQAPRKGGSSQALWWVAGAAVVVVGGLIAYSTLGATKTAPTAATIAAKSDADVHANRSLKGTASAKVKLVEFGDFL